MESPPDVDDPPRDGCNFIFIPRSSIQQINIARRPEGVTKAFRHLINISQWVRQTHIREPVAEARSEPHRGRTPNPQEKREEYRFPRESNLRRQGHSVVPDRPQVGTTRSDQKTVVGVRYGPHGADCDQRVLAHSRIHGEMNLIGAATIG